MSIDTLHDTATCEVGTRYQIYTLKTGALKQGVSTLCDSSAPCTTQSIKDVSESTESAHAVYEFLAHSNLRPSQIQRHSSRDELSRLRYVFAEGNLLFAFPVFWFARPDHNDTANQIGPSRARTRIYGISDGVKPVPRLPSDVDFLTS